MINKKAFTLIELLVVIAVIALLMSILMPALGMAKEVARRLICATHLKSIGTGLHLYAQENDGKMIPNAKFNGTEYPDGIDPTIYKPWWSYNAGRDRDPEDRSKDILKPVQLGKLFSLQYIEVPAVFYCPTARLTLDKDDKDIKYYTENLAKFMPPGKDSGWGIPEFDEDGDIEQNLRSNYLYWTWEETSLAEVPNKPLVVDSMVNIAHKRAGRPFGVNALFGGGNVSTTTVASRPLILDYVNGNWNMRGRNYDCLVDALEQLRP